MQSEFTELKKANNAEIPKEIESQNIEHHMNEADTEQQKQINVPLQQEEPLQEEHRRVLRQDIKQIMVETNALVKSQRTEKILSEWEELNVPEYVEQQNEQLTKTLRQHQAQVKIERSKKRLATYHAKFKKYRVTICNDPILNPEKKLKALYRLTLPYKEEIAECSRNRNSLPEEINRDMDFLSELLQMNLPGMTDNLIRRLGIINGSTTRDLQSDAAQRARNLDGSERVVCNEAWDENLSDLQKKAITRVDAYLSRHATDDSGNLSFINRILSCTMRERLFLYHCIENDTLESVSNTDILLGQTDYVPSEAAIKKALLGRSYIFFKKIRWTKLEAALTLLNRNETKDGIQRGHEIKTQENEAQNHGYAELGENDIENAATRQLCNDILRARFESHKASKECKAIIDKIKNTDLDEDALKYELVKLKANIGTLEAKEEVFERLKNEMPQAEVAKIKTMQPTNPKLKIVISVFTKTNKYQATAEKIDVLKDHLEGLLSAKKIGNIISGSSTALLGVLTMADSIISLHNLSKAMDSGDYNNFETGAKMLSGGFNVVSGGITTLLGAGTIAFAGELAKGAGKMSEKAAEFANLAKAGGMVTTGIALTGDVIDLGIQAKHQYHHLRAKGKINNLVETGNLTGVEKHHAQALLVLDHRNKRKQARTSLAKATGDGASMAALISGNPIAIAGVAVGSIVLNIGTKVLNYAIGKRTLRRTIDDFFDIDKNLDDFISKEERNRLYQSNPFLLKRSIRLKLREHMASELGFVNYESLAKHIIDKYADFIYKSIFYKPNGEPIYDNQKNEYPLSEACVQFAKGLGLRIVFPRNAEDRTKRHPSLAAIKKGLAI